MAALSSISGNHNYGVFASSHVRIRRSTLLPGIAASDLQRRATSADSDELAKIQRLKLAVEAFRSRQFLPFQRAASVPSVTATAVSDNAVDFGPAGWTELRSTQEVNTAATSYSPFQPALQGSTATAPWALGSSAEATIGGTYDGSNGTDTLTFEVTQAGTRGVDDLEITVRNSLGSTLETIAVNQADATETVYTLLNGLEVTFGDGDLVINDQFTVNLSLESTSFSPTQQGWTGSTAEATIGGFYLGFNGTGDLKFEAVTGGTHGVDDLAIDVFAPDDSWIQRINVRRNDPIGQIYVLNNGLTFSLGAGTLIAGESFEVFVDAFDPAATSPRQPEWTVGTATASIAGTYDGALGNGTMTFVADSTGTRGTDDLRIKVYAPDGSALGDIDILKEDALDTVYTVSNGLNLTLGAGDLIAGESFELTLVSQGDFSTNPHPVASTALFTLNGVYDGSQGTSTLTFKVKDGGTHGTDDLVLDVFDDNDTLIESVTIQATDPLDQAYQLSNGLRFQMSSGFLKPLETFTVDVDHTTPGAVDPDASFDSVGNDRPNLDDGFVVTSGSFDVNGYRINVEEDDSINSVLARINQSSADVTATFDTGTETVLLKRSTPGDHPVTVTNDTSGFLAATKLANAVATYSGHNAATPIGQIASLSAISDGTLRVNDQDIALDTVSDSIDDVVSRMNESPAGVTASFGAATHKLQITSKSLADLKLDSNGTSFFEAFGIAPGILTSTSGTAINGRRRSVGPQTRNQLTRAMRTLAAAFADIFDTSDDPSGGSRLEPLRSTLRSVVADSFKEGASDFVTEFGITFDFSGDANSVFEFGSRSEREFDLALKSSAGARALRDFLFGGDSADDGLAERIQLAVSDAERDQAAATASGAYSNPRS